MSAPKHTKGPACQCDDCLLYRSEGQAENAWRNGGYYVAPEEAAREHELIDRDERKLALARAEGGRK
jgi:hypothetical protein